MVQYLRLRTYVLDQLKDGMKTTDELFNELKKRHPRQMSNRRALATIIRGIPDVTNPNLNETNKWKLKGVK